MNTESVVKNLRVLWRTDRIIADIRMRHMLIGLGLRAFAALIATGLAGIDDRSARVVHVLTSPWADLTNALVVSELGAEVGGPTLFRIHAAATTAVGIERLGFLRWCLGPWYGHPSQACACESHVQPPPQQKARVRFDATTRS